MSQAQKSEKQKKEYSEKGSETSYNSYQQSEEYCGSPTRYECTIGLKGKEEKAALSIQDDGRYKMIKILRRQNNNKGQEKSYNKKLIYGIEILDITLLSTDEDRLIIKSKQFEAGLHIFFKTKSLAQDCYARLLEMAPFIKGGRIKSKKQRNETILGHKFAARKTEYLLDCSSERNDFDSIDESAVATKSPKLGESQEEKALIQSIHRIYCQDKRKQEINSMVQAKILTIKEYYSHLYKLEKQKVSTLRKQNDQLKERVTRLEMESTMLRKSLENYQNRLNQKQQERDRERRELEQKIAQLNKKLSQQKERNWRIEIQNASLLQQNTKNREDKQRQLQKNTMELEQKCKQKGDELKNATINLQKAKQETMALRTKLNNLSKERDNLKHQLEQSEYNYIFDGDVIGAQNPTKKFLREAIQRFTSQKIMRTRIIYKFDSLNTVNFHLYIDNHPHIVIIVKTKAGALLAAFTEGPFRQKQPSSQRGLLFSLTNMKMFELIPGRRAITYDDFYIIFGNSEFRIRSQEKKIYSNFGIGNGYYNSSNHRVDVLLQEGNNREVDIDHYEVHEIIYS